MVFRYFMMVTVAGMILNGVVGCATVEFRDDGFYNLKQNYIVKFNDPENGTFVGDQWAVDNYKYTDKKPSHRKRKDGLDYRGSIFFDWDENGTAEKYKEYFTDLELRHKRTSASIWITTRGLTPKCNETDLSVFLKNYIESLSGEVSTSSAVDVFGHAIERTRKYATMVTNKRSRMFGPYEAVEATITRANLDQLQIDKEHLSSKLQILITRIDGTTKIESLTQGSPVEAPGKVLMIIGYYSAPEHFDAGLPEFEKFLSLIYFKPDGDESSTEIPAVKNSQEQGSLKEVPGSTIESTTTSTELPEQKPETVADKPASDAVNSDAVVDEIK
ncbi:MAG: hypothetical protein GY854_03580 [Deltaproteobacteria bacterium]|nr:hypothetical protein [Deltaproteobacteria bacterium]